MAGRLAHFVVAGAAIVGGMAVQGDLDLGSDSHDRAIERSVEETVDRATDGVTDNIGGRQAQVDSATNRELAAAVADLVRAEGSLITAQMDDDLPTSVIKQVEQRRDAARQAVDRIAADIRAESRADRDARRRNIRDDVRERVRDAVRS